LIAIYGPTASGKTSLAERLAEALDAQLINADAFQMYRYFDIGTAKPERKELYRLIDILNPDESCGVGQWVTWAIEEATKAWDRRQSVIVVGGTGLYLRALMEEYSEMSPPPDPRLREELVRRQEADGFEALVQELREKAPDIARKTDLRNPARVRRALERTIMGISPMQIHLPSFQKVKFALDLDKSTLDTLIERRITKMLQNGWVREVERILELGYRPDSPAFRAIGYTEIRQYLENQLDWESTYERIVNATRQYAKRQKTWLRKEPRLIQLESVGCDDALFIEAKDRLLLASN
jgi:tRNA dimethylallyltransferase